MGLIVAVILPWVLGVQVAALLLGPRGSVSKKLAHGYLLGSMMTIVFLQAFHLLGCRLSFSAIAMCMGAFIAGIGILSFRSAWGALAFYRGSGWRLAATLSWRHLAALAVLTAIFVQLALVAVETTQRPTFPWDAWRGWEPETLQAYDAQIPIKQNSDCGQLRNRGNAGSSLDDAGSRRTQTSNDASSLAFGLRGHRVCHLCTQPRSRQPDGEPSLRLWRVEHALPLNTRSPRRLRGHMADPFFHTGLACLAGIRDVQATAASGPDLPLRADLHTLQERRPGNGVDTAVLPARRSIALEEGFHSHAALCGRSRNHVADCGAGGLVARQFADTGSWHTRAGQRIHQVAARSESSTCSLARYSRPSGKQR
jgi:hypothetical protein